MSANCVDPKVTAAVLRAKLTSSIARRTHSRTLIIGEEKRDCGESISVEVASQTRERDGDCLIKL